MSQIDVLSETLNFLKTRPSCSRGYAQAFEQLFRTLEPMVRKNYTNLSSYIKTYVDWEEYRAEVRYELWMSLERFIVPANPEGIGPNFLSYFKYRLRALLTSLRRFWSKSERLGGIWPHEFEGERDHDEGLFSEKTKREFWTTSGLPQQLLLETVEVILKKAFPSSRAKYIPAILEILQGEVTFQEVAARHGLNPESLRRNYHQAMVLLRREWN